MSEKTKVDEVREFVDTIKGAKSEDWFISKCLLKFADALKELQGRLEALEERFGCLVGQPAIRDLVTNKRSGKDRRVGVVSRRNMAFWTADRRKGERRKG